MVANFVMKAFTTVFGSRNERMVKAYRRRVEQINALEPEVRKLTDEQLRARTAEFREQIAKGQKVSALVPQIMATAREVMDRAVGIRSIFNPAHHFDPNRLPANARAVYDRVLAQSQNLPPIEVAGAAEPVPGWMQVTIEPELYNAVRTLFPESRPPFRARPFDVQLIGGMVLGEGKISEMKTGEGKTIVAPLACYVACLEQLQCHVVTVNDYLVQRDRDWVFPFYHWLGLTVGAIHPFHMQHPMKKKEAYFCNVVYGTNSEFGFDYLRDNMKLSVQEQVQRRRDFCIIDEVDSILIDEARTPLIISGPAHDDAPRYDLADKVARHLVQKQREWDQADTKVQQTIMKLKGLEGDIRNTRDKARIPQMKAQMQELERQKPALEQARDAHVRFYEVEREKKAAHLTHEGVAEAQKAAGISSFYVGQDMDFPHLLENALRAHVVYQRDRDYVVQGDEVVIVDEFTGRLMIGRQWSDGLHQAVEAKEGVKIKQETQTFATVTIQNFFKLYKRLAGMTGTAQTEATEFHEIYGLDVVSIPTNLPVIRRDYNDIIYVSTKDKWNAIIEEIAHYHDLGRPVLVGTTSVEKSEMLSQMLSKKHGIKHEVLNAKQHEREAHIVENAGSLGAVMIATNMAGRGTDIKLQPIDRAALVRHWQQRNLLSREARPELDDAALINLAYRHIASQQLGIKPRDLEARSDDEVQLMLLRHWVGQYAFTDEAKAQRLTADEMRRKLDAIPGFDLHRLRVYSHIEQLGGLHIVGTERHEARRIDNQLRGRAGRQGDQGSSRFFISLEDDLMQLFAGKATLAALSKLGMKEGDAIEHSWLTSSVQKAQRKVEQRNYEIRKSLLEYDEVMEHQRSYFYTLRQQVLEGRQVSDVGMSYVAKSIEDAVGTYLDRGYVQGQVAEWCRQTLEVSVDPAKLPTDDQRDLENRIRDDVRNDIQQTVDVTVGEYVSQEVPQEEWDWRGLVAWAKTRYGVEVTVDELKDLDLGEVRRRIADAATELAEQRDLSELAKFMDKLYGERQLTAWAKDKFGIEVTPEEISKLDGDRVVERLVERAREAYRFREVVYPVQFILDMVFEAAKQDGQWAAAQLAHWTNARYDLNWTPQSVFSRTREELGNELVQIAQTWWTGGELEKCVDAAIAQHKDDRELAAWASRRFSVEFDVDKFIATADKRQMLIDLGRTMLRAELTQLERFVLVQVLDTAWKDHLYAMDQLKEAVGLRGFAERDPRIEYKREGGNLFRQMQASVRDRVTDLIFRARLTAAVEQRSVYQDARAAQPQAPNAVAAAAAVARAAPQGDGQTPDGQPAESPEVQLSRHARRAKAAEARSTPPAKPESAPAFKERKKKSR